MQSINPMSAYNHTGNKRMRFPGLGSLGPGGTLDLNPPWTGNMCIEFN